MSQIRWKEAQQYEQGYWRGIATQIARGSASQLDWYSWRADQLKARLIRAGRPDLADGSAAVVEVGCGPIGTVSYFPGRERVAVDPLEGFYSSDPVLSELRSPAVRYMSGVGENLPLEDAAFDLVIIENCIDHVQDVHGVMRELRRVLRRTGVLYLTVNCRTRAGYYSHRLLSALSVDAGHPHTFTPPRVVRLLKGHDLAVEELEAGSYWTALRQDLRSGARGRAKALLGVSEYLVSVLARPDVERAARSAIRATQGMNSP